MHLLLPFPLSLMGWLSTMCEYSIPLITVSPSLNHTRHGALHRLTPSNRIVTRNRSLQYTLPVCEWYDDVTFYCLGLKYACSSQVQGTSTSSVFSITQPLTRWETIFTVADLSKMSPSAHPTISSFINCLPSLPTTISNSGPGSTS
jgi:hypothetical protein